jgi:hypothetical protein
MVWPSITVPSSSSSLLFFFIHPFILCPFQLLHLLNPSIPYCIIFFSASSVVNRQHPVLPSSSSSLVYLYPHNPHIDTDTRPDPYLGKGIYRDYSD